jgi:amidase
VRSQSLAHLTRCAPRPYRVLAAPRPYRVLIAALLCGVVDSGCVRQPAPPPASRTAPAIDVAELSIADAQRRIAAGALTSEALTRAYLQRIADLDDAGPALSAVIDVNASAVADAQALDAERRAGKTRSQLHGVPVLIKDNIDVAGMVNSAGALAFADNRPPTDAFLIQRLRSAGAVILGRTNLSEWANFRSTRSTSGWSSRGGQTKNPYALDRNPCGSSAGSAVAVAASLVSVAVGTETNGSIICPASVNGIVGLKPTVGLVSRRGIIPVAASQDTAGPMGRSVADVAALLSAMVGIDEMDPASRGVPRSSPVEYAASLKADALKGQRIGVLRQALPGAGDVKAALEMAVTTMRSAGATVVDVQMPAYGSWNKFQMDVLLYEFKDGINRYLAGSRSSQRSLADLIAWNRANAAQAMPFFGQELFEQAQNKGALTEAAYISARDSARRLAREEGLIAALDGQNLAAIVAQSTGPAWKTDYSRGDRGSGPSGYVVAAIAGTPSITIPIGESNGLPFGLTLMGRPFSEAQLIGFAYALEQLTHARRPPAFVASVD